MRFNVVSWNFSASSRALRSSISVRIRSRSSHVILIPSRNSNVSSANTASSKYDDANLQPSKLNFFNPFTPASCLSANALSFTRLPSNRKELTCGNAFKCANERTPHRFIESDSSASKPRNVFSLNCRNGFSSARIFRRLRRFFNPSRFCKRLFETSTKDRSWSFWSCNRTSRRESMRLYRTFSSFSWGKNCS